MIDSPYDVLLADPPWHYNDRYAIHLHTTKGPTRFGGGACAQYSLMKDADLMALPIGDLAAKTSVMFLWATAPKMAEGVVNAALDAWGFDGKTIAFVWEKTNRDGTPWYGTGYYTGSNAEYVILATRKKGKTLKPAERPYQIVRAPHPIDPATRKKIHSAKPQTVRDRIDMMYPDLKKIELFARDQQPGWDATGLDLDGIDIRDLLAATTGKRKAA